MTSLPYRGQNWSDRARSHGGFVGCNGRRFNPFETVVLEIFGTHVATAPQSTPEFSPQYSATEESLMFRVAGVDGEKEGVHSRYLQKRL
jgi:hypothetical protein